MLIKSVRILVVGGVSFQARIKPIDVIDKLTSAVVMVVSREFGNKQKFNFY